VAEITDDEIEKWIKELGGSPLALSIAVNAIKVSNSIYLDTLTV